MGPSANDFSNRRRPGRRGDGPGMGSGRGPARGPSPGGGSARGPGGGPRDGARGRTGRGLNDQRRPSASTFRRVGPRPEGQGPGGFEGRRWTRDREEGTAGDTGRRGEGGGSQRPTAPDDRPKWRLARRAEGGAPARPFRPMRPVFPGRGDGAPSDTALPQGDSHAAAAPSELIWGRHAALAALESERPIHRIWCTPEMRFRPTFLQLLREAKASGVLVEEVTWARLGQISGGAVHQGIVLQPAAADTLDLPSLIDGCRQLGESPLLVAVDGLTDPQNLGAILRSAEALGVHGLVLPQRRNAGLTGSVAKVAAGALEHLPVARVVNLNRSLETLRQEGYRVVGLDPQGSVSLEEADLEGPLVVITGSEGQGLSVLTRRSCDQLVRIPLRGSTPSLNASVATALVLYEVARRGWMRGLKGMAKPPRLVRPIVPTEAPLSEAQTGSARFSPESSPTKEIPASTLRPAASAAAALSTPGDDTTAAIAAAASGSVGAGAFHPAVDGAPRASGADGLLERAHQELEGEVLPSQPASTPPEPLAPVPQAPGPADDAPSASAPPAFPLESADLEAARGSTDLEATPGSTDLESSLGSADLAAASGSADLEAPFASGALGAAPLVSRQESAVPPELAMAERARVALAAGENPPTSLPPAPEPPFAAAQRQQPAERPGAGSLARHSTEGRLETPATEPVPGPAATPDPLAAPASFASDIHL
ncbi:MAG: 23S rRNA (guanosine(2251)-2'-O)-methyltransferase RlmB [Cyanobacteriota bacterium]|nr:23S rRNA (guanosine(2251)-2'-O)-methyltransferase RlmB [Cyanobacteriota bacterium]